MIILSYSLDLSKRKQFILGLPRNPPIRPRNSGRRKSRELQLNVLLLRLNKIISATVVVKNKLDTLGGSQDLSVNRKNKHNTYILCTHCTVAQRTPRYIILKRIYLSFFL